MAARVGLSLEKKKREVRSLPTHTGSSTNVLAQLRCRSARDTCKDFRLMRLQISVASEAREGLPANLSARSEPLQGEGEKEAARGAQCAL